MARETLDSLRAEVANATRDLQTAVDALDDAAAEHLGVNRTDLRCLDVLLRAGSARPGELGAELGLTTGSVTALLDRLEKLGYVSRSPDPTDRRKIVVRPTARVQRKAEVLYGPLVESGYRTLAHYSRAELEILLDFLRRSRALQEEQVQRIRAITAAGEPRERKRT
ncbi:DNA-binding transcriptional regulator, MarR family [Streptoalloteichus tenebrarius]|uniref:DNA-binding transcriptional regulator, MarR family n=1 Tax=Streptoalloteichus tenebrarius (strain ATCC 17920 / DSM 40477 / JCM 4838 / CBS 697.72 / NBRC 16177 / NCIMB 11028 / NRRL B-12390 / A12253. 1 / ISP 5477) TaxID=1933 RepID=A0ABT1HPT9_STRSD|nr:MarR family transcriptional regulator [Streptoalloteichus tenebrarius]MCP2257532.1 DNA-binding transcriptional regulator, MarR family [Streptoalloteichus tenebrarius]